MKNLLVLVLATTSIPAFSAANDKSTKSLADRPLLGSSHEFQMSCVAAANTELHSAICAELDAGIERLRALSP